MQKRRRPRDTRGTPEGRQGIHPTPWQWILSHACHAKAAETKGHQRDARGTPGRTSDPLAMDIVPRLPRRTGGDQATPQRDARAYIRPLGNGHCPTPATQKRRRPRDTRGTPEGRQRDARASDPLAMDIVPRLPRKSGGDQGTPEGRQRDARAYIRPLGNGHCPTPATQKRRRPRDTRQTPEGRQGIIRPLGNGHCPTPATQKRRRPRDTRQTPEGRQGVHPTPCDVYVNVSVSVSVCVSDEWCVCVCVSVMNDVCESDVWCVCVSDEWCVCVYE